MISYRKILILGISLPILGATVYSMKYAGKPCGGENAKSKEYQCPRLYECVIVSNEPNALGQCKFMPNGIRFSSTEVVGNEVAVTPTQKDPAVEYDLQTQKAKRLAVAQNKTGFELIKNIAYADETNSKNIVISPTEITLPVLALYGQTDGQTKYQITDSLNIESFSVIQLNEAAKILIERLNTAGIEGVNYTSPRAFWLREAVKPNQTFISDAQNYYGIQTQFIDENISNDEYVNNWLNGNTGGKIQNISNGFANRLPVYAIGATYYKGNWRYSFDIEENPESNFSNQDGTSNKVIMMKLEDNDLNHLETDQFKAVKLDIGPDGKYYMIIFISKDVGINKFLGNLSIDNWNTWMSSFSKKPAYLKLPKFSIEYEADMVPALRNIGLTTITSQEAEVVNLLDKTDSTEKFFLSSSPHKTLIEIEESGFTKATPVKIYTPEEKLKIKATDVVEPINIDINKPFFFAVVEKETSANIVLGIVRSL